MCKYNILLFFANYKLNFVRIPVCINHKLISSLTSPLPLTEIIIIIISFKTSAAR